MKYINLFLASSIVEFDYERQAIGNFVRSLNDIYAQKGIYFKLHMCEDMSEAISEGRKQDEYNRIARSCDYFFMLVHRKAGKYTLEEFDEALDSYRKNKDKPLIFAFVKPTSGEEQPLEVRDFLERYCGELQQYPSIFDGVDTIKLKMLLHLERSLGSAMELTFRDSELMIGDRRLECVHLDRVPMYSNSEAIGDLRDEAAELERELCELRESGEGEESASYRRKARMLERTRNELRAVESQLIQAAKNITSYMASGRGVSERARRAAELLDEGRAEDAIAILDDALRREELRSATERADRAVAEAAEALSEVQKLVDEALIKIEAIRMQPLTGERAEEMIRLYREAEASIARYNFDRQPLIAYAILLREQNRFAEALAEAESLYEYYRSRPDAPARDRAEVSDILGRLYYVTHGEKFAEAERLYLEAIALAEEIDDRAEVSFVYNNLGFYYKAICRFDKAKEAFSRSCELRQALSEEDSSYRAKYAWSANSLADVYFETAEWDRAITLYETALRIRREVAKTSSGDVMYVARTCHNLARVYLETNNLARAEVCATEAIAHRRLLVQINPDVHSGLAAQSCILLATVCMRDQRTEEARSLLDEAESFLESSIDAFTAERRANLWSARGELAERVGDSAEPFYRRALELRRERARNGAVAVMIDVAKDCSALARSLVAIGRLDEAGSLLREATETVSRYLDRNPSVYRALLDRLTRSAEQIN